MNVLKTQNNILLTLIAAICFVFSAITISLAEIGIWTSASEIANIPMSGCAWDDVKAEADAVDGADADVSNQDGNNNVGILAAGIVYARTGTQSYKDEVVEACQVLESGGKPADRTLAWAREVGAYAMAADLVEYYDSDFQTWCRNMAQVYVAQDGRTLYEMFRERPNNWGAHAFGALCALYAYLQDSDSLQAVRDYWAQTVTGPKPSDVSYGSDLSWHVDQNNLRRINPKGAVKQGMNIDGVIPDDMRRGGSFKEPPGSTGYPWEYLQGELMAARILDRAGMSIWATADSALYRAAYCLQIRYENDYGGWAATGDDEWQLSYFDDAYGTNWGAAYDTCTSRLFDHGKNAGWGWVNLEDGSGTTTTTTTGGSTTTTTTTTTTSGPVDDVADSDIAVKGTVSGSYTDTHTSNDVYESIEERESGGKPSNRYSYLEHKWTIDVTGGGSVTFYIEAYHTSNSEGDDFVFAYSTDDENYTNMVTVTKTSDDDTYQSYGLPSSLSGTVYIRVKDTDQTPGNKTLDIIYIDHMYIHSAPSKGLFPAEEVEVVLPKDVLLYSNYPNPFNPSTTIRYSLPQSGHVKLAVYDMMGRTVSVLVDMIKNAGEYTHVWEAVDSEGNALPSGVYFCRLNVGSHVETMKMMYMR